MSRVNCLILASCFAVIGCEQKPAGPTTAPKRVTSEDVHRDVDQAARTATEYSRQAVEEFQKSLEAKLKDLDAEIAKLREKGQDLKEQAKANWEVKMTELEAKREVVRVKLTEVGQSSAEAWKDVKTGAQAAWEELDKAFREAAREF